MPAQLGQHPRLNLSGYVPGKQNPLGQELLAGVLGQVIGNYMRPDYSGELAERGIEDPRNKVQKVLGVRPTDQAVSQMMGNVTAEQRTADTGEYYDKTTQLERRRQDLGNQNAARQRELDVMFGSFDRATTAGRDAFNKQTTREAQEIARQNAEVQQMLTEAKVRNLDASTQGQLNQNATQGAMDERMRKDEFIRQVPEVIPEIVRQQVPDLYDQFQAEMGQPPATWQQLNEWRLNKTQEEEAALHIAAPAFDPVAYSERKAFEQTNPVTNFMRVLQELTENYMGSRQEMAAPQGTAFDIYQQAQQR